MSAQLDGKGKPKAESRVKRDFKVAGTRPIRHDGLDKVTGRANYGADFSLPGMIHGVVLRSPHGHARIVSIDTSAAAALPGVKAIITGADIVESSAQVLMGEGSGDMKSLGDNVMARSKVLYHGHAVAAVAATTIDIARERPGASRSCTKSCRSSSISKRP